MIEHAPPVPPADRAAWDHFAAVAREYLPAFLLRQRWYPAKDAGPPAAALATLVPIAVPGLTAAVAIWTVEPPARPPLRLFLPLAVFPEGHLSATEPAAIAALPGQSGVLGDAFAADDFVRQFARLMLDNDAEIPAELQPGRTAAIDTLGREPAQGWPIRRSSAQQSNTSIRIGDAAIMKVIRKLEQGVHPELEMGRFLSERAHFSATPALLGWIDSAASTLAVLQAFVPNEGDGWAWILERLRGSAAQRHSTLPWIRKLGERTAQMHVALATSTGDAAFEPEPARASDWQRWMGEIEAMARRVLDALNGKRRELDATARLTADAFEDRSSDLAGILSRLVPAASGVAKTRHHGDYHLGQVLVTGGDVTIVDFEGEPLRPLAERRAKHVPLRDVASMLRSFAYAAAVAERDLPESLPANRRAESVASLQNWAGEAADAYLESYFGRAGAGDREAATRLVRFFTIEKALYEVLYEVANRPEWVPIPLCSVLALLDQPNGGQTRGRPQRRLARVHHLPQGAELQPGGGVRFRLWAPGCDQMRLSWHTPTRGEPIEIAAMEAIGEGWHEFTAPHAGPGTRYEFVMPDGTHVPDPASRFQPDDVHGASEVIDPADFAWQDGAWTGRPWHEAVVYEIHIGAFTPSGTFRAAIDRLDHLVALGVTAIEIMPVADFPGTRNWGYDGVLLYAPDSSYGRPEDLKALVDAAHSRGLMVLLDVVYNHFGPDGNYLPAYAPAFFTERHKTPWGAAINFDGAHSKPVREFIIHNALYWIEEYNVDGLRLDAVHAILDDGSKHVLDELAERVRAGARAVHLVLENEENQASRLIRGPNGLPVHYTAQWNDDVHHVLHVAVTGEDKGYYADYLGDAEKLGRALAEGFAFQGQMMEFRGERRGEPSAMLPPTAFVAFIQNHDQIGNRAFGERLTSIAVPAAVRAAAAVYLLLPQVPMLFMGEEWGARQPFAFFCDFSGDLADAVRSGRRQEFAKFPEFQDEAIRLRIPDPQAENTFAAAKLDWADVAKPEHAVWYTLYRRLLAKRREAIVPELQRLDGDAGRYEMLGRGAVIVRWRLHRARELTLMLNLSADRARGFSAAGGSELWREGEARKDGTVDPWFVRWSIQ